jgi:hypothetical protein
MTQCSRVLNLAKRYNGICQSELLGLYNEADGGPAITRLAARIQDLEDQGHVFELLPDRKGTRTYRWVSGPDVGRVPGTTTPPVESPTPGPAEDSSSAEPEQLALLTAPVALNHWKDSEAA